MAVINVRNAFYLGESSIAVGNALFNEDQVAVPVITLVGSGVSINLGDSYVEPGFSASDAVDGDITGSVIVTGTVDGNTAGVYTLRYNVTNSNGNAATEVIRLVTVGTFWQHTPPQSRVLKFENEPRHVVQDKDAALSYWLDFSGLVGGQTISAVTVTTPSGITADLIGANSQQETDNNGDNYGAGTLVGLKLSGGVNAQSYDIVVRFTLTGGDVDERTVAVHVADL